MYPESSSEIISSRTTRDILSDWTTMITKGCNLSSVFNNSLDIIYLLNYIIERYIVIGW